MSGLTFNEDKHEYQYNKLTVPSVTQIISGAGLVNFDFISKELLEEKADLGRKIHTTTELYDQDILEISTLHPILVNYLESWAKFKKDYGFIIKELEEMYFHPLYRFAGRVDRVGFIKDKLCILDIKSGVKSKTHGLQTAAYKLLYNYGKPKKELAKDRYIVYLTQDGYKVEQNKEETDEQVFLAALTIFNYQRRK